MLVAKSMSEWKKKIIEEGGSLAENILVCYRVIDELLDTEKVLPNTSGLLNEHNKVLEIVEKLQICNTYELRDREKLLIHRYGETAYLVWALYFKFDRKDIIRKNYKEWFTGEDLAGTSHFRNFEFESTITLRFIEEDIKIDIINEKDFHGYPDLLANDSFYLECKRTTRFFGILTNVLKALKQAKRVDKPTVVILNLDYLYNEIEDIHISMNRYYFLLICSKISEFAMGIEKSNLIGVILEYVDEYNLSEDGSNIIAIRNEAIDGQITDVQLEEIWGTISNALCGDYRLEVFGSSMNCLNRFNDANVTDRKQFYNSRVINEIKIILESEKEKMNKEKIDTIINLITEND
ncbi:hypothetical protein [Clostridium sp.]|uniref:hypothetical protein n=1 Tax=Clostridium sp. TaxID=1506 RepID=UPI003216593F